MGQTVTMPESISSRTDFKRKFSFAEMYRSFVFVPGAVSRLGSNKKGNWVDEDLVRRIQLAVTEVNGCPACSYQHTKMALEQGMSSEEISSFLSGGDQFITAAEAKAIVFAQHFADARGYPTAAAYGAIVQEYGNQKAGVIVAACQLMIAGNMYGIPYSAFQSRIKGKPYTESSLFFELGMLIGGVVVMPFALLHGLLRRLVGLPKLELDRSTAAQ